VRDDPALAILFAIFPAFFATCASMRFGQAIETRSKPC